MRWLKHSTKPFPSSLSAYISIFTCMIYYLCLILGWPQMPREKSTTRSSRSQKTESSGVTVEHFADSGNIDNSHYPFNKIETQNATVQVRGIAVGESIKGNLKLSFFALITGLVGQQGPSLWVIIMAVVCIIALVLPLDSDKYTGSVPHYLLLSVNQKLLASFILGRHGCFFCYFH